MIEKREGKSAMERVGWEGRAAVQWWVKISGVLGVWVLELWGATVAVLGSENGGEDRYETYIL